MTDDHSRPASDGAFPMIFRPTRRILPSGCLKCGLSLNACQSRGEYESDRCCPGCDHD